MDENLRRRILDCIKMPRLRIERALIVTQSYKETEGEPMIIRRAKAFHELANKMPIVIEDWQLVVGCFSAEPFAVSPNPEGCWKAIVAGLDEFATRKGEKYRVSEEDKKALRETLPWWQGKSIQDTAFAMLPSEVRDAYETGLMDTGYFTAGSGNFTADYGMVLSKGFSGIAEEVRARMSSLDISKPSDLDKWLFYQAALICCDAAIDYGKRYADLARSMAETEASEGRRKDLIGIAANCDRVPAYPARTFAEAVQAFWFTHILLHFDATGGAGIVAGRLDRYLWPYAKDADGAEVRKWLKNLWINYNQVMYFLPGRSAYVWSGHPVSEQPTIGGIDEAGRDASNELTKMILEVDREVGLPQPDIAVMCHDGIDSEVLEKACDVLPVTMKPKFFNARVAAEQGVLRGMSKDDLTDIVAIGCVASGPEGRIWGNNGASFLNLPKVLELALNNGVDPVSGKKIGIETGDPTLFRSFDELKDAYEKQLAHAIRLTVIMMNVIEKVHSELNPEPFVSLLIHDCIEKGAPVWKGGARYNIPGVEAVGLANVADSLAAVRKLVFDEKSVSMKELLEALHADLDGRWENLRQRLVNGAPKYGNDDDYVDSLAADVASMFCKKLMEFNSPRGPYCPSLASVSAHVGLGGYVGALPDGRKAGRPLADGMSPAQGVCFKGPTAVIRSVTKVNHAAANDGTLLNMKFSAGVLKNPESRRKFIQALQAYMDLGGYHVQFNFIDTQLLRDAQAHPEKYQDLLVRVAAYVAQFRQLPKELQDDIIARSELGV